MKIYRSTLVIALAAVMSTWGFAMAQVSAETPAETQFEEAAAGVGDQMLLMQRGPRGGQKGPRDGSGRGDGAGPRQDGSGPHGKGNGPGGGKGCAPGR